MICRNLESKSTNTSSYMASQLSPFQGGERVEPHNHLSLIFQCSNHETDLNRASISSNLGAKMQSYLKKHLDNHVRHLMPFESFSHQLQAKEHINSPEDETTYKRLLASFPFRVKVDHIFPPTFPLLFASVYSTFSWVFRPLDSKKRGLKCPSTN